jgi:hypothetical protein
MRRRLLALLGPIGLVVAANLSGCTAAPLPPSSNGSSASHASKKSSSHSSSSSSGDDDDDDTKSGAPSGDPDGALAGAAGRTAPASAYSCNGAGIAAFADKLVAAAKTSCTSNGAGVVTDTNFDCLKEPLFSLAPPFPQAAFDRVSYWAKNGNNFAGKTTLFQCVEFAFAVTAAVCGQPINNGDAQIDQNMQIPGYTYMSARSSAAQPGDVLVMDGHIAITAGLLGGKNIRVAEANCLTLGGQMSNGDDTGVISNTRTDTLDDTWILGWYRKQ